MTSDSVRMRAILTYQSDILVIEDAVTDENSPYPHPEDAGEPGPEQRRWSVDDILADPLGYQHFVDARIEADAEFWVEQQMRELAEARQERQQTFLARVRGSLVRLFTRRR